MVIHYFKHPLDGCRERARRADEHLAELERQIALAFKKQAHTAPFNLDPNPPHRVINEGLPPETFAGVRLGTLTGEACYNFRCALDYLIYALAKLDSGTPRKKTQFPIMDTVEQFKGQSKIMLCGVSTAHVATIEQLQPYMGCNWTKRLAAISNMDKHRHLVTGGGNTKITIHSGLEKDLTNILGVKSTTTHPITGKEVNMRVHVFGQMTLEDGTPVIEAIKEIKTGVADTLVSFEPDFV
jgi:hypothetical protein